MERTVLRPWQSRAGFHFDVQCLTIEFYTKSGFTFLFTFLLSWVRTRGDTSTTASVFSRTCDVNRTAPAILPPPSSACHGH